jgi:hypothetical protein
MAGNSKRTGHASGQNGAMRRPPDPPYWAAIFTSRRNEQPGDGYEETADRMFELASEQPDSRLRQCAQRRARHHGLLLGERSAIAAWKAHAEHAAAQREGRARWYESYDLRIARVERAYGFDRAP